MTPETKAELDRFLAHYGVKGMKWGVHRARGSGTVTKKPDSIKNLSDEELKAKVDRMNLEQRYNNLNARKSKQGHDKVKELLAYGATINAVIAFAASPAGKMVAKKVTALMGSKEAAGISADLLT